MTVYLGLYGSVQLKRKGEATNKASVVDPADVNASRRRFSFDFDAGFLVSGDQIEITSTDGTNLAFVTSAGWVDQTVQSSGKWFINVDELGGIRLYNTFAESLTGEPFAAIPLVDIATAIPITVKVANATSHMLGQVTSYELNTNRETADITTLSDEFRQQYSTLMSGSGQLTAQWDYLDAQEAGTQEAPHYLLQLAVRTEIGSQFSAKFYLKSPDTPANQSFAYEDSIWYEVDGIITQAGVSFAADSVVQVVADFITTGPIRIRARLSAEDRLKQESGSSLELDQDPDSFLLLDRAQ